jgi:hypothetical protein
MSLQVLCWVISVILCVVAAVWDPGPRFRIGWLGVAFLALGFAVGGIALD